MKDLEELRAACAFARAHAEAGLKKFPFDGVYSHALEQIALVEPVAQGLLPLRSLAAAKIDVGLMAAKTLGNDEQDFASALHTLQWYADKAAAPGA